ncbi:3-oxoacyl-[acyl-carrier-protein] synthase II [Catenulispora sp. MAP5-51]
MDIVDIENIMDIGDSGNTAVAVTGFGAVTPVGADAPSAWKAMLAGQSGVRTLPQETTAGLQVRIGAPADIDLAAVIPSSRLRTMDRCAGLALTAALEAWRHAGLPEVDPERLAVSVGTGIGGFSTTVSVLDTFRERGWRRLSPFSAPMLMPNSPAAWIGIELDARAGVHTSVSACASGAEAIGYGMEMIRSGRADVVVAGGAEAMITPELLGMFSAMQALSLRNDEPERASRPFDRDRDGFVLGEGAGILVLESAAHAARRGAEVLAVAAGVGFSADAHHITAPHPEGSGLALAMRNALADARATAQDVVHVNAHATSTRAGDAAEAAAVRAVLGAHRGDRRPVVSATKSMTGHLVGAAGAVEAVAAICALRDGLAPPTINLDEPDPSTAAGLDIATEPRRLPVAAGRSVALSNSSGFGGHNVSLAFRTVG